MHSLVIVDIEDLGESLAGLTPSEANRIPSELIPVEPTTCSSVPEPNGQEPPTALSGR